MEERHNGDEQAKRGGWAGRNETAPIARVMPAPSAEVV